MCWHKPTLCRTTLFLVVQTKQNVASRAEISTDDTLARRINCISLIYLENVYLELDLTLVDDQTLAAWFRNINVSCQGTRTLRLVAQSNVGE